MQADGDSIDLFLRRSFGRLVLSRAKWSSGLLEVWINFFFFFLSGLGKLKCTETLGYLIILPCNFVI